MKRVPPPLSRLLVLPVLLLIPALPASADCPATVPAAILGWIEAVRGDAGCGPVASDPVLDRAAGAYAAQLAERRVLSHRGPDGTDVLDRVQAAGGTSTLVGEILGSGPDPRAVTAAWGASLGHRSVVENPVWTHLGVGCSALGNRQVWVVLFAARRIPGLEIVSLPEGGSDAGFRVSGQLTREAGLSPVLLSGLRRLEPSLWLPASGRFVFEIPRDRGTLYHRLGYRDPEGRVTITDAFYPEEIATSSP